MPRPVVKPRGSQLAALPPSPSVEVNECLAQLRPLQWQVFSARQPPAARFNAYLARYHYLPYRSAVGDYAQMPIMRSWGSN